MEHLEIAEPECCLVAAQRQHAPRPVEQRARIRFLHIDRECTVIGTGSRVEVWDTAAWEEYLASTEQAFADQSEEVIPGLM